MSPLALWLYIVLLIGSAAASDVPFVFGEGSSNAASYTSAQLEQASIASPDLTGVPPVSYAADNATIEFPIVGGGSAPGGTTEKTAEEFRKLFDSRVEPDNSKVHEKALVLVAKYPGDRTIDQISSIYEYLKDGWHYVGDPRGVNNFFYANETLNVGEEANCAGVGDCGDFAILMSALVESVGDATRIVLASNNTTGGHAYAEVYLGQLNDPNGQVDAVINWLRQDFETDKIFVNINTSTKEVWLNLDWWPDQTGNPHPGGPFFTGDKNIVLYIRGNYQKFPLRLPEKTNKQPKLISLTSDELSPQDTGTAVTWTAEAKDPDKDPVIYRFFLNDDPETKWVKENKWVWNTTDDDIGDNRIEVRVRDGKHAGPNGFDDHKSSSFNITMPETRPITTTNTIGPSPAAPVPATQLAPKLPEAPQRMAQGDQLSSEVVVFPDPKLDAVIRVAINKPQGTIYAADLEKIVNIYANYTGIKDINGLEYCTNLQTLELYENRITDVSPLAGLTNLQTLALSSNQITDVSPLAALTNLQTLELYENRITDVSPLASLTNLQTLALSWNQIADVSSLAGLTNPQELDLSSNQITDVSPLAGLTNLQALYLNMNRITDVSSLASLTKLQTLELSTNQITDVSSLAGLKNLTWLWLIDNPITDVSSLASLKNLYISR